MISEKLLSEVMGYEVKDFIVKDNLLKLDALYSLDMSNKHRILGYRKSINIYELAHMCKKWASKSGWDIWSGVENANVHKKTSDDIYYSVCAKTEPEAIFKACEWILNRGEK